VPEPEPEPKPAPMPRGVGGGPAPSPAPTMPPQPSPTPTPGAMTCVATPGLNRGVRDAHCARCAHGYKWWPCSEAILCQCSGQAGAPAPATPAPAPVPAVAAPTPSPMPVPEPEPEPEPEPATVPAPGTMTCVATPGLNRGVRDADCAKCAQGYKWWPCNEAILCQCSGPQLAQVRQRSLRQARRHKTIGAALVQDGARLERTEMELPEDEDAFAEEEL